MKTAYLVVCYKNAAQVCRLLRQLEKGQGDVFLHADREMPQADYRQLAAYCNGSSRCHLVSQRLHGVLDDRSLVDITMGCIRAAREYAAEQGVHYDYYALLSGQDYPIRPIAWVETQLEKTYPEAFLDCTAIADGNWVSRKFTRNRYLIRYRRFVMRRFKGPVRRAFQALGLVQRRIAALFGCTTAQRMKRKGITLYGGSAWWILPDGIVEEIDRAYCTQHPLAMALLEESCTPEETFFQTLAMQTAFAPDIYVNGPRDIDQHCKTYADFGGKSGRERSFHPYVLTLVDFDRLKASSAWFARKFEPQTDEKILTKIDSELL